MKSVIRFGVQSAKREFYLDAYKKFENRRIKEV